MPLRLRLHNTTTTGLVISGEWTKRAASSVTVDLRDATLVQLNVGYRPASTLFNGTYTDELIIHACRDEACNQPLQGSPVRITLAYTVTGTDPQTGQEGPFDAQAPPLAVQSRVALSHDVIDAEYSRSLDRVVMVATSPRNALYIYDAATFSEQSLSLEKRPTAVSLSPDGLTAAVGHDGFISIVNLATFGQQPAPAPLLLNVSADAFDVEMDGRNRVHAIPNTEEPANIHTVEIATGAEHLSYFNPPVYGQSYVRVHPSGDYLFVGDPQMSPTKMVKWDITGDAATFTSQSANFDMAYIGSCGKIWFNESGSHVYSQCGHAFAPDGPPNTDLPKIGRLGLSGPEITTDAYTITWLDQYATRNEITLIEANAFWCKMPMFREPCYHRLGVFDDNAPFTRRAHYALDPLMVNGMLYGQRGLFVFYKADGSSKILVSRLDAIPDPNAEYYLSVLE